MQLHKATIDSREYYLRTSRDMDYVKRHVSKSVRRGGGVVGLKTASHRLVEVLVTPSTRATFESFDIPEEIASAVHLPLLEEHYDL